MLHVYVAHTMKYIRWMFGLIFIGLATLQVTDYDGFSSLMLATRIVDSQLVHWAIIMCIVIELLLGTTFFLSHGDQDE